MQRFGYLVILLMFVSSVSLIPTIGAQDDGTPVVATTQSNLNVRAEPSVGSALVGTLTANTTVDVLKRFQNEVDEVWLLVPFEDSEAWIASWLVDIKGDINTVPWARLAPGVAPISTENLDRLSIVANFPSHYPVNMLRFEWLPDGRLLVGRTGSIEVYATDGQLLETWTMPYDFETFIVHPSGEWLLYLRQSFMPRGVFSYNIATGEHQYWDQIRLPGWHSAWVADYAWSGDGSRLMLYNSWSQMTKNKYRYQTYVIDVSDRSIVGQLDMECNGFVETNHTLRCQYSNMTAYTVYDIETGETGESLAASQLATASGIEFIRVGLPIFSDDDSFIFYSGSDKSYTYHLIMADATTLEPLKRYTGSVFVEALTSDSSLAVMREYTGTVQYHVIEPLTGNFRFDLPDFNTVSGKFSPDDAYLAIHFTGPVRPVFQVYETASGNLLWEIKVPEDAAFITGFSEDGQALLQGLLDARLVYRNIVSGETRSIWQRQGASNPFEAMYNLDPLGRHITLGERDQNYTVIYDADTMAETQRISLGTDYFSFGALYSRDGNYVLRYIGDGAVVLDLQHGEAPDKLIGHDLDRRSHSCFQSDWFEMSRQPFLPISPENGMVALSNTCDQGIVLWRYNEDENFALPTEYEPLFLQFQADGRLLALGSDSAIHIYDVTSQEEIATQHTPYIPVTMLDDSLIVLETPGLQYVFWDMEAEQIIGQALDSRPYLLSQDGYLMLGIRGDQVIVYGITEE